MQVQILFGAPLKYKQPNGCFLNVNNKGKNAVLISEDEWKNIEETLLLSNIPGFVNEINNIRKNEDWDKAKEFKPNEE